MEGRVKGKWLAVCICNYKFSGDALCFQGNLEAKNAVLHGVAQKI